MTRRKECPTHSIDCLNIAGNENNKGFSLLCNIKNPKIVIDASKRQIQNAINNGYPLKLLPKRCENYKNDIQKIIDSIPDEEMAIYAEEDRLYLKSLKQELTEEEEKNMCGGLRCPKNK